MQQMILQFIQTYIPGFEWFIFAILLHFVMSTAAHLKAGDFKISEWPNFLKVWLLFMVAVVFVNGAVSVAGLLVSGAILQPILGTLQAFLYGVYFIYYLDNIVKHATMIGLPSELGLLDAIRIIKARIKQLVTGDTTTTTTIDTTESTPAGSDESENNTTGGI